MRPSHLALVGLALLAFVVAVLVALGSGPRVLAADPGRLASAGVGVWPGGDVDADAASATSESTAMRGRRTAIASDAPPPVIAKAVARAKPRVRGRVVDERGQGVPGARIWITTSDFWARVPLDLEEEALPTRWIEIERPVCDAQGRFVFEELESGRIRLAARAAGFAPAYREDLEHLREHDVELPDIALARGVAIVGEVLGVDGKPAAGVQVLIAADSLTRGGGLQVPGRGVPAGATDAHGRFRVDELAPGPFHILFLPEGLALAELSGRTDRAGELQDGFVVRLSIGVAIAGRVVSSQGDLPADLRVVARHSSPEQDGEGEALDETADPGARDEAECEARPRTEPVASDGTFRIAGLRSGETYRLTLSQKRGEAWKPAGSTPGKVQSAPAGGTEIVYEPESVLTLRVVDDATSQPIEDLIVWVGLGRLLPLRDEKNEVRRNFPLGAVRSTDLRPQANSKPCSLRIGSPGYEDFEQKDLRIAAGSELDLGEVRLKPERRIVATVVDSAGNPVEAARVIVTAVKENQLRSWSRMPAKYDLWGELTCRYGRTGADGTCTLSSLPGKRVLVQASARGFVPSEVVALLLRKDVDSALTLKLEVGATVVVSVRDGAGRAVVGVPVGHRLPADPSNPGEDVFDGNVQTDARGEARFEALELGVHAFRIQQEDGESSWWAEDGESEAREAPWQELTVASSAELQLSLVAPPRGTLLGTVRENGRPLEGAVVKLVPYVEGREEGWTWSGGGRDPFSDTTDHRGDYRIESRRAGEYVVLVHHRERRMPSEFRIVLGSGEQVQDFALDTNAIEGSVTDPEGRPLVGVRVEVYRAEAGMQMEPPASMILTVDDLGNPNLDWRQDGANREARTDAQGRFVLRGLIENTGLFVHCQGDDVENKTSEPIVLAPGEIRRGVDFELRRAGRIRVELVGELKDNRWYQVSVVERTADTENVLNQAWLAKWNRDETIGSIVPGAYTLRLASRDHQGNEVRLAEMPVEVEVGQVARARFQVP
jgi:uncharacterized GH25 family protein